MLICPHRDDPEADSMSVSTARSKSIPDAESIVRGDPIPPLRDGDRLTHDEFMRCYEAMPDLRKAELIEGVVYVPSPVRSDQHGEPHPTWGGGGFFTDRGLTGSRSRITPPCTWTSATRLSQTTYCSSNPTAGGRRESTRMAISSALRSWWPRSPPARPATILTPSCRLTNAIVSRAHRLACRRP